MRKRRNPARPRSSIQRIGGHPSLTRADTAKLLKEARDAYRFSRRPGRGGWRGEDATRLRAYYKGIGDTITAIVSGYGHGRRRRYSRVLENPMGMKSGTMLGVAIIGVGAWLLFRTPANGGPSLWQTLTTPAPPYPVGYGTGAPGTIPGALVTSGGNVIQAIGHTISGWID